MLDAGDILLSLRLCTFYVCIGTQPHRNLQSLGNWNKPSRRRHVQWITSFASAEPIWGQEADGSATMQYPSIDLSVGSVVWALPAARQGHHMDLKSLRWEVWGGLPIWCPRNSWHFLYPLLWPQIACIKSVGYFDSHLLYGRGGRHVWKPTLNKREILLSTGRAT